MVSVSLTSSPYPTTRSWERTAWPHDPGRRWALRLACGLPLVAIALVTARTGFVSPELTELSDRAQRVRDGDGLEQLSSAYPPLPTLTAAALPGSTVWISVISALFGGFALQLSMARLVRRRIGLLLGGLLIVALVTSPAIWYEATQNPSQFMALMFLVIAIDGFVRFVVRDDTAGGFASGLAVAGAFLCDPVGVAFVVAIGACAPLLARVPGFNPRNRAAMIVLIFPTISTMLSWAFLEWRFSGSAFATVQDQETLFAHDLAGLGNALAEVASIVSLAIIYLAVASILIFRRKRATATLLVPLLGMTLTALVGLSFPGGLGLALLTFVAVYTVPRYLTRIEQAVLVIAAVAQVVLGLWWSMSDSDLAPFVDALCRDAVCP